jgi:cell fate regulator YaaT (PSP1 superfamily)
MYLNALKFQTKIMACTSCGVAKDGKPGGCSGNCSGGCNRMNTFDWLAQLDIHDVENDFDLVEVSFKNGSHKDFFHNPSFAHASTGDWVLVEIPGGGGYDIGKISLTGDLVRLQLKKKSVKEGSLFLNIIRKANPRDLEKLDEIRAFERASMVKARVISRTLDLDMKIGDVEFQGDGRKATFFYTADGRVDFRELIRHFAKEFKVKIEMRQIGARQESSRVGGIGSCGRELCCSTWLSDFKSVSTTAARYQQLAINQAKLSGMCGRLKCCLNYELDSYLDALQDFPENPERIKTKSGLAVLIKTDVFKGLMIYVFDTGPEKGKFYTLGVPQVKQVLSMNKKGEMPENLKDLQFVPVVVAKGQDGEDDDDYDEDVDYGGDLVGAVELPDDKKKKKKKKKKPFENNNRAERSDRPANPNPNRPENGSNGNNGSTRNNDTRNNDNRNNDNRRPHPPRTDGPPRRDNPNQPRTDAPPRRDNPNQPKADAPPRRDNPNPIRTDAPPRRDNPNQNPPSPPNPDNPNGNNNPNGNDRRNNNDRKKFNDRRNFNKNRDNRDNPDNDKKIE